MLDFETCNAARIRRDSNFDGVFFTAVRTTKIYCRPVCPVKHPLTKNVRYYPTAAAEKAPFSAAWNGTQTTVTRALRLIEEGALDNSTVDDLAAKLGVGARHLSRLFSRHVRASPSQVAKTVRIQRAKRLLSDSSLSITEIAFQSGFGSVRRFNAAFLELYGRSPSSIRRPKT